MTTYLCPGLGVEVENCGEPCLGGTCLRQVRAERATASQDVARLGAELLATQSEVTMLAMRLARVAACLRQAANDADAVQLVKAVLSGEGA